MLKTTLDVTIKIQIVFYGMVVEVVLVVQES